MTTTDAPPRRGLMLCPVCGGAKWFRRASARWMACCLACSITTIEPGTTIEIAIYPEPERVAHVVETRKGWH